MSTTRPSRLGLARGGRLDRVDLHALDPAVVEHEVGCRDLAQRVDLDARLEEQAAAHASRARTASCVAAGRGLRLRRALAEAVGSASSARTANSASTARRAHSPTKMERPASGALSPRTSSKKRDTLPRSALLAVDRALQLRLVHPRAALDAELLRLVVELVARAAPRAGRAGAQAAAAARRDVLGRRRRAVRDSPRARALLVDGPRGDLLRALLRAPRSFWLSLMCSYWRARLVPFFTPRAACGDLPSDRYGLHLPGKRRIHRLAWRADRPDE